MKRITFIITTLILIMGLGQGVQAQCNGGNNCYIAISATDGYGDGWNGNTLSFIQDGVTIGTYTLSGGASGSDTIRICTENGAISLSWSTGSYPDEIGFSLTDSLGGVLYSRSDCSGLSGTFATIDPCPSCPMPAGVNATNITSTSATLSWTDNGTTSGWVYSIGTTPIAETWTNTSYAGFDASELDGNTLYYVYVRSICSGSDTSLAASYTFRTACGNTVLPLSEGFESNGSNIPFCWQILESQYYDPYGYGGTTYPYVNYDSYGYGGYGHNSTAALYMQSYTGPVSVASPLIPIAANTIEVKLWVSGGSTLQVGYVTDLTTPDFHVVGTVGPTTYDSYNYSYTWSEYTVAFDTVSDTGNVYVMLRRLQEMDDQAIRVDDITIREINSCSDPWGLAKDDTAAIVSGQVSLVWEDTVGSQWEVAYGPEGFAPSSCGTQTATVTICGTQIATATNATIAGLSDSITYDFYVRTVCGAQSSYWVGPVTIRPNVYAVTGSVDTIVSCGITITDDGGLFGNFSENMNQVIVIMPSEESQAVRLQGYAHLYSSYSYYENKMRIFAGADTNGMLLADINSTDVDNIDITSEIGPLTISFSTASYSYYLNEGFAFHVTCEDLAECTTPYNLTISDIGGTYATVDWEYNTDLGDANGFHIFLTDLTDSTTTEYTIDGGDRTMTLESLNERTSYLLRLAVDCEGIDTISTQFATVCSVGGEQQIGEGTTTSYYIPAYGYEYAIGQQIFTASELGGAESIFGFKVYRTNSGTAMRLWDIYLDTTDATSYGMASDYIAPSADKRYFSGHVDLTQGWVEVTLDSAFMLPQSKNLVLTVYDHTGSYGTSSYHVTNTSDNKTVYGYSYSSPLDPLSSNPFANLSYGYGTLNSRNSIIFLTPCSSSDCMPPLITATTPDTTSIMVEWESQNGESEWMVEYRHADSSAWVLAATGVSDNYYTVSGLMAATKYHIRVSSLCSDDTNGASLTATTLCPRYSLPFIEDFEGFTAPNDMAETENCWYRASDYVSYYGSYYYPYASDYSYYAMQGSWSISMYGYRSRLVLPTFNAAANTLYVDFYAMCSYYSTYYDTPQLEVGVCTDPSDTLTYTVVDTLTLQGEDNEYINFSVDLDSYTGADGNIFIRVVSHDYSPIYIDSITVDVIPTCRRVAGATFGELTTSSAVISVSDPYSRNNYTVYYNTEDNYQSAIDSVTFSGTSDTITGLMSGTAYYAWVRANCTGSDRSSAYAVGMFTTLCEAIAVSDDTIFFEDLESGELECMTQEYDASRIKWENVTYSSSIHPYSGGHMLKFGNNSDGETMLVLPTFDFTGMSANATLSFYHNWYGNYGYVAPSLAVYYRTGISGQWTHITDIDTTESDVWKKRIVALPMSQGAAIYQVALKSRTNGNSMGLYIDDITVQKPNACEMPSGVTVSDITNRTATVHWVGSGSSYKVQYRSIGDWNWNARLVEGVDSVVLTPLEMLTEYEVRVVTVCGTFEQSEPSETVRFTTEFCGDRVEGTNYSASVPATSSNSFFDLLHSANYSEMVIDSAELAGVGNIDGISFYIDNSHSMNEIENCQIYIGHSDSSHLEAFAFDSSFVLVYDGDISISNGWNRLLINPIAWDGQRNIIIGFFTSASSTYYNDTISVRCHEAADNKRISAYYSGYGSVTPSQFNMMPASNKTITNLVPDMTIYSCNPTCDEPIVTGLATTAASVEVEWYNEGATVELQIRPAGSETWSDTVSVSETNRYTFEGLAEISAYEIRLHRDCREAETGYSEWVVLNAQTDTACSVPTDMSVVSLSNSTATFAWTDNNQGTTRWEIHVWNGSFERYYDVETNPATVTGLASGMQYSAEVRSNCGGSYSEFSEALTFDNTCYPVTSLTATVSGHDVVLRWTAGQYNSQWVVTWGVAGFDLNEQLGYMIVDTNMAIISGLDGINGKGTEGFNYGFRVRAICGEGWSSEWSANEVTVHTTTGDEPEGIVEVEVEGPLFEVVPNPAREKVNIKLTDYEGVADITVVSIEGRTVMAGRTIEGELTLDVRELAAGTYFVRIQTTSWSDVRKLIVKN